MLYNLVSIVLLLAVAAAQTDQPPPTRPRPKKFQYVRCVDANYPYCYNKDVYCPDRCKYGCEISCGSCQPLCLPQPTTPPAIYVDPLSPDLYTPPFPTTPTVSEAPTTTPTGTKAPSTPTGPEVAPMKVYCKNKGYPHCYRIQQTCPSSCPNHCEVDCDTCSPVCECNRPGAVCQDPRFIGGDGITFYFHGKKDQNFCIVSDSNLHINAHFIGKRNQTMKRDFTWVQSIGILFDNHKLYIGAKKTTAWNNRADRLLVTFDSQSVNLPDGEGKKWEQPTIPGRVITITRSRDTNAVTIEVPGNFQIKATVVPITETESRIHNYGITNEDCFAHLDLSFKFYSLSGYVNGVLGQTYANNYVSRVKMGIEMPVLGGEKQFASSSLFSTDCAVARFNGTSSNASKNFEFANLKCGSEISGRGVVCKR